MSLKLGTIADARKVELSLTWTTVSGVSFYTPGVTRQVLSTAFGNGVWVAGGQGDSNQNTVGRMAQSTNLISWTSVNSLSATNDKNGIPLGVNIYTMVFGNGMFVFGTDIGEIRRSTNGINWTTSTKIHDRRFQASAHWNEYLYLGGYSTSIIRSTDAITWTTVFWAGGLNRIDEIKTNNNTMIAKYSVLSTYFKSTNGLSWTTHDLPFSASNTGLVWHKDKWISISNGRRAISKDGENWDVVSSPIRLGPTGTIGNKTLSSFNDTLFLLSYIGSTVDGVFVYSRIMYSIDDGYSWKDIDADLGSTSANIEPFISQDKFLAFGTYGGLFTAERTIQ
jgi:hypothetical protein